MDINALRAMRTSDFSKISKELEKIANPDSNRGQDDNRYWKLERDKTGNGSAVIRFLPKTEKDELPWVKHYSHGFKGPTGRWYIEDSLSTIGEEDGVAVLNRELWNSGLESNKEQARKQKRRLSYISNILVVSDPKNPENEGKVFLFKYGKKIFDKINDAMRPTFPDEKPMNAFDLWEGANFKLRIKTVDDFPNYDQSVFDSPSELYAGNEDKLVATLNQAHPLHELVDPKNFKSREELDKRLAWVLDANASGGSRRSAEDALADAGIVEKQDPVRQEPVRQEKEAPTQKAAPQADDSELDDFLSKFDID